MNRTIQRIFITFEKFFIIILAIGIILTVFYGVLVRYLPITGTQMAWTQEVAQLILIWFAFFTIAVVQRKNEHFNLDYLQSKLRGISQKALAIFIHILSIVFLIFIAINSFSFIINTGGDISAILQFPLLLFPLALFISSCLMIAYTCNNLIVELKKSRMT
jgi:TRAP-type C4-dicarboxylate transport system permease small subunit